jgi:two-component system OmpR family sensor kinase
MLNFIKTTSGHLSHAQLRLKVMAGVVLVTLVALAAFDIGAVAIMRRVMLGQTDSNLQNALASVTPNLKAILQQKSGSGSSRAVPAPGDVKFATCPVSGGTDPGGTASGTAVPRVPVSGCPVSASGRAAGGPPDFPGFGQIFAPVSVYGISYVSSNGGQVVLQIAANGNAPPLWTLTPANTRVVAKPGSHTIVVQASGASTDGAVASGQVRVTSVKVAGGVLVAGTSLASVDQTIDYAGLIVAAGSGLVVLLIAAGVFLVLRRGLRPIEAMAAQADRITAGDLTQRVSPRYPRSEVGRLGAALNGMLSRIQASVDERVASERHMRRFFADASHELRTPLASLRANAELYTLGVVCAGAELDEVMRRITLEAQRMSGLVDDMFRLARLGAQPVRSREPVDLSELAGSCAERARVAEPARTWLLHVAPGLLVAGDEELLRRAIDNLLANVRVHTPGTATGVITVAGSADGERVLVDVSDDGPGVPPAMLPHIFERFYRAGAASARPGSGLGLAIVAEIAAAHGGSATAAPGAPAGLRVTLDLPRVLPAADLGHDHDDRGEDGEPHDGRDPTGDRVPGDAGGHDDQHGHQH